MKLLFPISVVLLLIVGCVPFIPSAPTPSAPPVAYIDSISATTISEGQTVTFSGHGTDVGGTVVAYNWRSDIDGVLDKSASFSTSSLSVGTHYIYFKVQDNSGDWSREMLAVILNVLPPGVIKPYITSFKATPEIILAGESTTLTWNVSDAITVAILPDIGNVPASGSRLVSPMLNTTYTLTATNKAGSVTAETRVTITQMSTKSIELLSIVGEEGSVNRSGEVDTAPKAGVIESGMPVQAFFSFDISMIPAGATLTSAYLDLTHCVIYGNPFDGRLGAMGIFPDQYGILKSSDYVLAFAGDSIVQTYSQPIRSYDYEQIATAIQKQVNAGSTRFQIRVQFEKFYYQMTSDSRSPNYLEFGKGMAKLTIHYK